MSHDRLEHLDSTPLWLEQPTDGGLRDEKQRNENLREGDLSADERATAERIEAWDRRIIAALHDVEPPADLKSRLLTAVDDAAEGDTAGDHTGNEGHELATPANRATPERSALSRQLFNRWTISAAAAATVAFVVLGMLWPFGQQADPLTITQVINEVEEQLSKNPAFGIESEKGPIPEGFEVPSHILVLPSVGYRRIDNFLGFPAVVHDLRIGTPRTMLFVIDTDEPIEGNLRIGGPPESPSDTGGRCIGVWRNEEGGPVYVLYIKGDKREYRQLVRTDEAA